MKGKTQISGVVLVEQLIKKIKEEVDECINKENKSDFSNLLKAELGKIIKDIDEAGDKTSQDHDPIFESNLQKELNKAEIIAQIELSTDAIWLIDSGYNIVSTNNVFKESFNKLFDGKASIGANVFDVLPENERIKWKERYNKTLNGEQVTVFDEYNIDNQTIYTETILNPLTTEDGIVGVSCFLKDITEKKQTEIALFQSQERYKNLLSSIPSVFYRCVNDKERTMEIISEEIVRLSGYPPADFINNKVRSFASIIYPKDKELVENILTQCELFKNPFELEYRLIHADGTIRWVMEKGRANIDDEGNIIGLDGFINDITKRKRTEKALKENEEKYKHIFLSISDLFVKTNADGIITLVTPSVENILGYSPDECVNKELYTFLKHPDDYTELREMLISNGTAKEFETVIISKDKKEITISLNARIIKDDNSEVVGFEGIARDISERKRVELELRSRTKELYSIFDNAPVILILADQFGNIINVNQPTSRFGSKYQQEILNKLSSVAIDCILALKQSKGCEKGESCKNCVIRNTFIDTLEGKRNFHQVGGKMIININDKEIERQVLISTSYIEFENSQRVLLSLDDITELSSAQEQVRKLSAAVEQSTATIVITDINGNIEYANPEFEKSTGYSIEEVIGKNPKILKSPKTSRETYSELWNTILDKKTWQGEFLNVKKDGTEYWENAIISPVFNHTGDMISFIAVKDDITERKQIQQELIKSEQELRQLNDEKSRYFSILAHDLRGLVGAFYGYTNLLSSEFENFTKDEIKEQLVILEKSAQDSLTLLDNLLEWARASLGSLVITIIDLNLHAEIRSIIDYLYDLAKSKGVNLVYNIDRDIIIPTDKNIINTIIRNLIGNAIKFTPSGGEIYVTGNMISEDMIEISVKDTGVGMDSETLKGLFKAGEKVVRQGTNNEVGTGLGLMICKEMVKRLNGSIHVESELGKGSRFYFRLPLKDNPGIAQ